ncbi:MAG: aminoacyl-tRNA hydrolase [Lachnospiraceae bacterium]
MKIIVGLGNPGKQYEKTRHNIGFEVIDALADKYNVSILEKKHKALIGKGMIGGEKVILVKPLTFMNLSGESVKDAALFYKVDEKTECIVVYDDISLEPGDIRLRKKGSAGGHNGIKSIIGHFGHDMFYRVKVGVGAKPANWDLADHVLGRFTTSEQVLMKEGVDASVKAIELLLTDGMEYAMNKCN